MQAERRPTWAQPKPIGAKLGLKASKTEQFGHVLVHIGPNMTELRVRATTAQVAPNTRRPTQAQHVEHGPIQTHHPKTVENSDKNAFSG